MCENFSILALFGRISGLYSATEIDHLDGPNFRDPEYPISPLSVHGNKSAMSYADFDSDFLPPGEYSVLP